MLSRSLGYDLPSEEEANREFESFQSVVLADDVQSRIVDSIRRMNNFWTAGQSHEMAKRLVARQDLEDQIVGVLLAVSS